MKFDVIVLIILIFSTDGLFFDRFVVLFRYFLSSVSLSKWRKKRSGKSG